MAIISNRKRFCLPFHSVRVQTKCDLIISDFVAILSFDFASTIFMSFFVWPRRMRAQIHLYHTATMLNIISMMSYYTLRIASVLVARTKEAILLVQEANIKLVANMDGSEVNLLKSWGGGI